MNFYHKNDDYETPIEYWRIINPYIPKDAKIHDPFYMNGNAKKKWAELGRDIIHENTDFFKINTTEENVFFVSNPPHHNFKKVLTHLFHLDRPFIMLIPIMKICNIKIQPLLISRNLQIIPSPIYKGFITADGIQTRCAPQYYCYLCWKANLSRDLLFLDYVKN